MAQRVSQQTNSLQTLNVINMKGRIKYHRHLLTSGQRWAIVCILGYIVFSVCITLPFYIFGFEGVSTKYEAFDPAIIFYFQIHIAVITVMIVGMLGFIAWASKFIN